jgi:predicted NAD-dependent protein-ADP-ribosyltransferase YbiA (DUF1768 family)
MLVMIAVRLNQTGFYRTRKKAKKDWMAASNLTQPTSSRGQEYLYKCKFIQNEDLRKLLLDTGTSELIEDNNWHDTFWGVCNGVGANKLGEILM